MHAGADVVEQALTVAGVASDDLFKAVILLQIGPLGLFLICSRSLFGKSKTRNRAQQIHIMKIHELSSEAYMAAVAAG